MEDVHSKVRKLQEALDELKKEIGFDEESKSENASEDEFGHDAGRGKADEDELGEEVNLSDNYEEDGQGHFDTHRL